MGLVTMVVVIISILVTSEYSASTVYTVASSDTTYRLCLDSNCCNTIDYGKFNNCCDDSYSVTAKYDTDLVGTPM